MEWGTQGIGGNGEDLGYWEDLGQQEDLGYKENKGKQKFKGEGGHSQRNSAQEERKRLAGSSHSGVLRAGDTPRADLSDTTAP